MAVLQVMEFLGIKVKYPITIYVDNTGAIYLANNSTVGGRTRHVNIRYHYVRQYIEDGIIKIEFVKSQDNIADAWTKNLSQELFHKHTSKYVKECPK